MIMVVIAEVDHIAIMVATVVIAEEVMAEEATVEDMIKDMITRDPLVVAMVVAIIIIMVAMEDTEAMDMIIMVVAGQEKVALAVEDMRVMLRDQNWILAKFKAVMEIMTLNTVQSILKLAILAKYLEMAKKQELVIMMRILDQSQRIQRRILANRRS